MSENKTKVMRLTESESQIVAYIRGHEEEVLEGIGRGLAGNPVLTNLARILSRGRLSSLDNLIDEGFISVDDSGYLLTAMKEGKNIVITGSAKTGKTRLLNALLTEVAESRLYVEESKLYVLGDTADITELVAITPRGKNEHLGITGVEVHEVEEIAAGTIEAICDSKENKSIRLVMDEVHNTSFQLGFIEALENGISTLVTSGTNNWMYGLTNQLGTKSIRKARKVLSAHDFIIVNLDKTGVVSILFEESIKE